MRWSRRLCRRQGHSPCGYTRNVYRRMHRWPCHAMPCHAMPCHAMPCHAMPCLVMPCHALPCYAARQPVLGHDLGHGLTALIGYAAPARLAVGCSRSALLAKVHLALRRLVCLCVSSCLSSASPCHSSWRSRSSEASTTSALSLPPLAPASFCTNRYVCCDGLLRL